ncbi:MAG: phosphate signaling complex protein PhoU [Alphaproteobacteria bacterium]
MTTGHHIVKSYDDELKALNNTIIEMANLTETQFESAIQALANQDTALAYKIIEDDDRIDDLDHAVDEMTMGLLALRQPMAMDLRNVVAAIKISSDLERIADYATNMARRTVPLVEEATVVRPIHAIPRMGQAVIEMLRNVVDAYIEGDADKAVAVWRADKEVDEMYVSLFRELLTYMMEDARRITPCTHVLFIAKNIERMGDHVTNVCETVYYLVTGEPLREDRPRKTRTDRLLTNDLETED